jgi:hypothetical protein
LKLQAAPIPPFATEPINHALSGAGNEMVAIARPLVTDPLVAAGSLPRWIAPHTDGASLAKAGFRLGRGGVHQSKTMMLRELSALLQAAPDPGSVDVSDLIINQNALLKKTGSARRLALQRLNGLYGFASAAPIGRVLARLWQRDDASRPLLALLCSLARDPSLRDSATAVLDAKLGSDVRWPDFASRFESLHPGRYSANMLRSMSQNCASTWTQSGHLWGRVKKRRVRAIPSPVAAAYAALLGELVGFGGATLLASPWIRTLKQRQWLSYAKRKAWACFARCAGPSSNHALRVPGHDRVDDRHGDPNP